MISATDLLCLQSFDGKYKILHGISTSRELLEKYKRELIDSVPASSLEGITIEILENNVNLLRPAIRVNSSETSYCLDQQTMITETDQLFHYYAPGCTSWNDRQFFRGDDTTCLINLTSKNRKILEPFSISKYLSVIPVQADVFYPDGV